MLNSDRKALESASDKVRDICAVYKPAGADPRRGRLVSRILSALL
jgi:hypothetical protein